MRAQISGGYALVQEKLREPPKGQRWVGPLAPVVLVEGRPAGPLFADEHPGDEVTRCYTPCFRGGLVTTDTSGRLCARTTAGWWVAVPNRPSMLAAQCAEQGATHEVGAAYSHQGVGVTGPLRERGPNHPWLGIRPSWAAGGVLWLWAPNHWTVVGAPEGRLPAAAAELARAWQIPQGKITTFPWPTQEVAAWEATHKVTAAAGAAVREQWAAFGYVADPSPELLELQANYERLVDLEDQLLQRLWHAVGL